MSQSISQTALTRDNELGNSLIAKLVDTNLVMVIQGQTKSPFTEVVDSSFILLGSYLKNNIDITELFIDVISFERMYERISSAPETSLKYMAWSLYIFTTRCFSPGSETAQLMHAVQACVTKLTDILRHGDILEQGSQQLLMQLVFLALGNVIHMHQPTELTR